MKSMIIGGIILVLALLAGTYFAAGDAFIGDDYINSLTMLGAVAIITITVFVALKYVNQMRNDTASGDLAEEKWDGIGEYKNAVPTGWALAFIGTIIWMFWYFTVGYPINGFSQVGQWNEETLEYNAKFEKKWENPSNETLKAMGQSTFLVQCAPCHGVDAEGISGKAHNLTKRISKEQVVYTIKNGANNFATAYPAGMPPMASMGLTDDADINAVADYVAGGFKGTQPVSFATCAGCHGDDGKGMEAVAPNIRAYDDALVMSVLKNGKKGSIGSMPSFDGRLNETQEKALATYLRSIGE
ncbi:MAG: c-type cytochrome [Campylobacterales bacterium]|nr:c-type cytochrome [Campylobacterales bacterium]